VTITWNNVWQYGTTTPSRFQVVLRQTGEIEIRYGTVRNTDAPCIVGFSPGNGNFGQDGTDVDFSTITTLRSGFSRPLTLAVPQRPVLGATMSLTTSAIPANAMFTSNLLSLTQYDPAIDLATYGAPGCNQYCGTEAADLVLGTGTQTRALGPVPLDPVWIGLEIFSQSASLVPGVNALQILTSNGVKLRIGGL
jgi:hypothetical protein